MTRVYDCLRKHAPGLDFAYRTVLPAVSVTPRPLIRNFSDRFVCIGSCFAGNVQRVLTAYGFPASYHPYWGYHTNPVSLADFLARLAARRPLTAADHYDQDGIAVTPFFYRLSACGPHRRAALRGKIAAAEAAARTVLRGAATIIITLGTTDVITMNNGGRVAMNSNGLPSRLYHHGTLSYAEVLTALQSTQRSLRRLVGRPFTLIVTVSPQRYGFSRGGNSPLVTSFAAKTVLRAAMQEFCAQQPATVYFPALELVLEELRLHENLARGNYTHIDEHTVWTVSERFLAFYSAAAVQRELEARHNLLIFERVVATRSYSDAPDDGDREILRRLLAGFTRELRTAFRGRVPPAITERLIQLAYRLRDYAAVRTLAKPLRRRHAAADYFAALAALYAGETAVAARELAAVAKRQRRRDPDRAANACWHLGELALDRRDRDDARAWFSRCRALNPRHQRARDIFTLLGDPA